MLWSSILVLRRLLLSQSSRALVTKRKATVNRPSFAAPTPRYLQQTALLRQHAAALCFLLHGSNTVCFAAPHAVLFQALPCSYMTAVLGWVGSGMRCAELPCPVLCFITKETVCMDLEKQLTTAVMRWIQLSHVCTTTGFCASCQSLQRTVKPHPILISVQTWAAYAPHALAHVSQSNPELLAGSTDI